MTLLKEAPDHFAVHPSGPELRPDDTALLTIDVKAIRKNYRALKSVVDGAECAAVVKADAYGLGVEPVVTALSHEGCRTFFVATIEEARQIAPLITQANIYVLNGLPPGAGEEFASLGVRPVLSSLQEVEEWATFCARTNNRLPAAIHIDTGMNRLGLSPSEVESLSRRPELFTCFNLCHVMSHLACADSPATQKNTEQLNHFLTLKTILPKCPASIANTAGILLGKPFHLNMVRPGIALYGGRALSQGMNPMKPVVRLDVRVLQVRYAEAGQTVSYGAEHTLSRPSRIATLAIGYADGYFRQLGKRDTKEKANVYFSGYPAPVLGRVSMDLICVDVTDIPEGLTERGATAEVIGPNINIDQIAENAGTIGYEVLTAMGQRFRREYLGQ